MRLFSAFETNKEMLMVVAQRANVIFGRPFDEGKYWDVISNAALLPDLMILPDGDLTEVSPLGHECLDQCPNSLDSDRRERRQ